MTLSLRSLRQARKNRLELVDDLCLDRRIIHSRLVIRITRANGNIAVAALEQDDIRLPWQTRAAAPVCILGTEETNVDASKDVLELAGVTAFRLRYRGEVDVEPGVRREIWRSTVDDSCSDVESKISVDLAVERSRLIESSRVSSPTGESDSWDLSRLCCISSCADCSREGRLDGDVGSNVWSSECEFRLCAVPQRGSSDINSLLDGSDRERVDVVQTRVLWVGACWRASRRARCVNATVWADDLGCCVG